MLQFLIFRFYKQSPDKQINESDWTENDLIAIRRVRVQIGRQCMCQENEEEQEYP